MSYDIDLSLDRIRGPNTKGHRIFRLTLSNCGSFRCCVVGKESGYAFQTRRPAGHLQRHGSGTRYSKISIQLRLEIQQQKQERYL